MGKSNIAERHFNEDIFKMGFGGGCNVMMGAKSQGSQNKLDGSADHWAECAVFCFCSWPQYDT